jgi:hypothetical protein
MNSLATPILHETSSNRASQHRILISLSGLAAFPWITLQLLCARGGQLAATAILKRSSQECSRLRAAHLGHRTVHIDLWYLPVRFMELATGFRNQSQLVSASSRAADKHPVRDSAGSLCVLTVRTGTRRVEQTYLRGQMRKVAVGIRSTSSLLGGCRVALREQLALLGISGGIVTGAICAVAVLYARAAQRESSASNELKVTSQRCHKRS